MFAEKLLKNEVNIFSIAELAASFSDVTAVVALDPAIGGSEIWIILPTLKDIRQT